MSAQYQYGSSGSFVIMKDVGAARSLGYLLEPCVLQRFLRSPQHYQRPECRESLGGHRTCPWNIGIDLGKRSSIRTCDLASWEDVSGENLEVVGEHVPGKIHGYLVLESSLDEVTPTWLAQDTCERGSSCGRRLLGSCLSVQVKHCWWKCVYSGLVCDHMPDLCKSSGRKVKVSMCLSMKAKVPLPYVRRLMNKLTLNLSLYISPRIRLYIIKSVYLKW